MFIQLRRISIVYLPSHADCGKVSGGDNMNKQLKGSACLAFATVIWGSAFIAQTVGMDHIGPFTFLAIRNVMGSVFLFLLSFITDRFLKDGKTAKERWCNPKLWKAALLCGTPLFVAAALQQMGIVNTDPGKSG